MTRFAQQFSRMGSPPLMRQFGEPVTYHPSTYAAGDARVDRSIEAIVVRDQLRQDSETGLAVLPAFQVQVRNDSTLGISSSELDTGGDQISFAVRVGEVATRRSITRIINHDHGMITLECR